MCVRGGVLPPNMCTLVPGVAADGGQWLAADELLALLARSRRFAFVSATAQAVPRPGPSSDGADEGGVTASWYKGKLRAVLDCTGRAPEAPSAPRAPVEAAVPVLASAAAGVAGGVVAVATTPT